MAQPVEPKGKQRRFADEYLVDCNATRAYKAAGYRAKNDAVAASSASKLLRISKVAAYVEKHQQRLAAKVLVTQEDVVRELKLCGFSSVADYDYDAAGNVTAKPEAGDAMRAVSGIKRRMTMDENGNTIVDTEVKLWSKTDALKMLGTHLGMFVEKVEVTLNLSDALSKARQRAKVGA